MTTVMERILKAHATKTLSEPLLELTLSKGGKAVATGEGKLSVKADGCLQIDVNAASIPFNFDPLVRGAMIPADQFYEINARTSDNLIFTASKVYTKSISADIKAGSRAIFEPGQVKLLAPIDQLNNSSFEVLMTPFEWDFVNCKCKVGEVNPVFGDRVDGFWLSEETEDAAIGLRKIESWVHLKINSKVADQDHAEKCAIAFVKALRFHAGKYLECFALIRTTNQTEEVTLFDLKLNNGPAFFKPLPPHEFHATEKLLMAGMRFFLQESSIPIYLAISHCWESRKLTFQPGCLLTCSVVEGMADYIVKDASEQFGRFRDLALGLLRKEPRATNTPYLDEFEKILGEMKFLKGKESIKESGKILKISITVEELKAWGQLRNRLAHGNFSLDVTSPSTLQAEFDAAASVANIVNKFILGLIQYEGVYCNYSSKGFPSCEFPSGTIVPKPPHFF